MQSLPGSAAGAQTNFFEATCWSVVLAAGRNEEAPEAAEAALARLCKTYWSPLYGFIRSRGYSVHDAQDLTQGFFAHLIEHRIYLRTRSDRGKFRSFLLASLKNFLMDARDREQALKRGGACEFLPLHEEQAQAAEAMFQTQASVCSDLADDRLFERQWAEAVIRSSLDRLSEEFKAEGKGELLASLEVFLRGGANPPPTYDELEARLGMPAATIRSHVTRLRARYRDALRAELRQTVDTAREVDEEVKRLLRVLTSR